MQSTPSNNHRRHSHYRSRGPFRPHLRNMTVQSASCDFCDSMITGTRYKCKDCPGTYTCLCVRWFRLGNYLMQHTYIDFDLCERCIVLADTQHPGHTFDMTQNGWRRCPMFQRPPTVNEGSNNNHSGVRCDGCEKWIYGVRYKVSTMFYKMEQGVLKLIHIDSVAIAQISTTAANVKLRLNITPITSF